MATANPIAPATTPPNSSGKNPGLFLSSVDTGADGGVEGLAAGVLVADGLVVDGLVAGGALSATSALAAGGVTRAAPGVTVAAPAGSAFRIASDFASDAGDFDTADLVVRAEAGPFFDEPFFDVVVGFVVRAKSYPPGRF